MAVRWSAVDSFEVPHSRQEAFTETGRFVPTVRLQCAWDDRFPLIQDLYTSSLGANLPTADQAKIGYNPRSWPNTTEGSSLGGMARATLDNVGVTSASLVPLSSEAYNELTNSDGTIAAPKSTALVDVKYGAYFNIRDTISYDTEVITQSYRDFAWVSKATNRDIRYVKELEIPVVILHQMVLTREFVGLSRGNLGVGNAPDIATLTSCLNRTNSLAYSSIHLGMDFKVGTLLMLEPEVIDSADMQTLDKGGGNAFGLDGHSVKVKFLYKPGEDREIQDLEKYERSRCDENTHNLFYRPRIVRDKTGESGGWDRLRIAQEAEQKTQWPLYEPFSQEPLIDSNWLLDPATPHLATASIP